jgi:hypothetical protein
MEGDQGGREWPSTKHLGQFTQETAEEIAAQLEDAGIFCWVKEPGFLSSIWEIGVRLFVDSSRLDEARAIAREVVSAREQKDD